MDKEKQIEEIEAKLAELKAEVAKDKLSNQRFNPEFGSEYWCASEDAVIYYTWQNDLIDRYLYKVGNCFRTKKEAEESTFVQILNDKYYYKLPNMSCHLDKVPEGAEGYHQYEWCPTVRAGLSFDEKGLYRWLK
jgi:hypothetical protein